jgi:hypothetical protein
MDVAYNTNAGVGRIGVVVILIFVLAK